MSIEFLLGLLLAIPLSILGNVLTRKFDDIMAKKSMSAKGKKLKTLAEEYERIKFYSENLSLQALRALGQILFGLSSLTIIVIVMGFNIIIAIETAHPSDLWFWGLPDFMRARWIHDSFLFVSLVLAAFIAAVTASWFSKKADDLYRVVNFHEYERKVKDQIVKLGGNPEELLKEEVSVPS